MEIYCKQDSAAYWNFIDTKTTEGHMNRKTCRGKLCLRCIEQIERNVGCKNYEEINR